jgi:hypothetical protein
MIIDRTTLADLEVFVSQDGKGDAAIKCFDPFLLF